MIALFSIHGTLLLKYNFFTRNTSIRNRTEIWQKFLVVLLLSCYPLSASLSVSRSYFSSQPKLFIITSKIINSFIIFGVTKQLVRYLSGTLCENFKQVTLFS